ncbi:hypothetical protein HYW76_01490 [Candidatus Pacearchaeota archaeon]|nr:hypothetical protein [Candidatus Pacearchaeota archaeon]
MKHNIKITLLLIGMFFITQLIGLAVINSYSPYQEISYNQTSGEYENITISKELPYGLQPPEISPEISLTSIVVAMIISIILILVLMKIQAKIFIRLWFFLVIVIALAIVFYSAISGVNYAPYIALVIALPLAFFKIFRRNIIVHNLTELLIYPGIAVIFVSILSFWTIIILLILISAYDIYAVNYAGFMQKMAKYQINTVKIFSGFFVPYADKKTKQKINFLKDKYKNNIPDKVIRKNKIKVSLAILGGGDVVFPIILAGVVLRSFGLIPALLVSVFATFGLIYLFVSAKKGKFYPAMPFITAGCFIGLILAFLLNLI